MSTLLYPNKVIQKESFPPVLELDNVSRLITSEKSEDVFIIDGSCSITASTMGLSAVITAHHRDPVLDITFDCLSNDEQGILISMGEIFGEWLNTFIAADPLKVNLTISGDYDKSISFSCIFNTSLTLKPNDDYIHFATSLKLNWVKWSNIGHLNFTVWKDNIAGERPLDWKGAVYSLKKLGNKVVAYGENGVSFLVPVGNTYGLNTVHRVGLKGRQAVSGNNSIQFFVDTKGRLFSLGEIPMKSNVFEASSYPQKLDYSEYLSDMSDLVLSWDEENRLLYICDGEKGYVYNPENYSLGAGPATITGVGSQGGILYIASPTLISTPAFEIGTDIYDFGTTKYKTIHEIEFGTNVSGVLQAAIEYRSDFTGDFKQTEWKDVMKKGNVFLTALGREFRFKAKITDYEYIELDYINIKGIIHDH